jgi:hypothetical protein
MRDLRLFERFADYEAYVREEVFADRRIPAHPFYDRLIGFVLDQRVPLFYDISDSAEHFAFSGTHNFQTLRAYDNPTLASLFYLHDFTHSLFFYPHDLGGVRLDPAGVRLDPGGVRLDELTRLFVQQERVASNETEVLVHYRVPSLREALWPERRLYVDVLRERGVPQPDPVELLALRTRLALDDPFGDRHLRDDPDLREWFRRWRTKTPAWCRRRYARQLPYRVPVFPTRWMTVGSYEAELRDYQPLRSQRRYEEQVLRNLAMGFALRGWDDPPLRFAKAPDAVERLEDEVLLGPLPASTLRACEKASSRCSRSASPPPAAFSSSRAPLRPPSRRPPPRRTPALSSS